MRSSASYLIQNRHLDVHEHQVELRPRIRRIIADDRLLQSLDGLLAILGFGDLGAPPVAGRTTASVVCQERRLPDGQFQAAPFEGP